MSARNGWRMTWQHTEGPQVPIGHVLAKASSDRCRSSVCTVAIRPDAGHGRDIDSRVVALKLITEGGLYLTPAVLMLPVFMKSAILRTEA